MSQELVLGKYEFYPYPKEFREPSPTLEELVELLRKAKAGTRRTLKRPHELLTGADHAVSNVAKSRETCDTSLKNVAGIK